MTRWPVSNVPVVDERHLLPIRGDHPPVLLRDLIVPPVNRIHRVSIDKFERHGIVARVLEVVLLSVKTGGIAEVAQKTDPAASVRLDFEHQTLAANGSC